MRKFINKKRNNSFIFVKAGANVHVGDKVARTPLFMATEGSHIDTFKVLMAAGAPSDRDFK